MTKQNEIYKCNICVNIVEVLHIGVGELVCCGQPMELLKEKTEDVGQEKHLPIIEKTATGVKVKVGSIPHPMEKEHYIEWIGVSTNGLSCKKFLNPGQEPSADFEIKSEKIEAREFCNIHGLWKT